MIGNCDIQVECMLDTYFENPFKLIFSEVVDEFVQQFELFLIVISDKESSVIQTVLES
jgi:hypothetical protein